MKRIVIIASIVLALLVLGGIAVPVLAADPAGSTPAPTQGTGRIGRAWILERLLLVRDEAKVDALLAKAVENGKISTEQSSKIKSFWTLHHEQAAKRAALRGLARIQDEAQLKTLLDNAVAGGRITSDQAAKITAAWENLHNK